MTQQRDQHTGQETSIFGKASLSVESTTAAARASSRRSLASNGPLTITIMTTRRRNALIRDVDEQQHADGSSTRFVMLLPYDLTD